MNMRWSILLVISVAMGCSDSDTNGAQSGDEDAGNQHSDAGVADGGGDATAGDATAGDATAGDATAGDATAGDATAGDATAGDGSSSGDGGCLTSCAAQGKNCGSIPDGCGGYLDCGFCSPPETCHGGGSANVCGGNVAITWTDEFQTGTTPWGMNGVGVAHPIGTSVAPDDANGSNLSVVDNPIGSGKAARLYGLLEPSARSQLGIYNDQHPPFDALATSGGGIYMAQEWYFPEVVSGGNWLNLWDWHSAVTHTGERWDTCPGLFLATDGSMKVNWDWHGANNPASADSDIPLPVGRWFEIEMHYTWTTSTTIVTLWIDGVEALRQEDVQTKGASHQLVQTYIKLYGAGAWTPQPTMRYVRNVRIAAERITVAP